MAGCTSERRTLVVDLRTDFAAGADFARVRTARATGEAQEATPSASDDLLRGVRVATFEGIATTDVRLRVQLLDDAGGVVAERPLAVQLDAAAVSVVVVITRNCAGVVCPGPEATACVDGRCVDPRCAPGAPEACGEAACGADAECTSRSACVDARCVEGLCLQVPVVPCGPDAGVPDAGMMDAGRPDAGRPDAGAECVVRDAGPAPSSGADAMVELADGGLIAVRCADPPPRGPTDPPFGCEPSEINGCRFGACDEVGEYRRSDGECVRATVACCRSEACAFNHGTDLPSGHFLRHYLWDFGVCAGNDCCRDCPRLALDGGVPGAERCRSGRARCVETIPRGDCYAGGGYCFCE